MIRDLFKNKKNSVIIIIAIISVQLFCLYGVRTFADETAHFAQINKMSHGARELNPYITTLPFFHYFFGEILIALRFLHVENIFILLKFVASPSEFGLNTTRIILAVVSAFFLIWINKKSLDQRNQKPKEALGSIEKTTDANKTEIRGNSSNGNNALLGAGILIATCPIIFPMLSLVYTDIFALVFVVASVVFAAQKRGFDSAFSILIAALIRQPAITWILLTMFFTAEPELKILYSDFRKISYRNTLGKVCSDIVTVINILKYHLSVLAFFIIYIILNKGIAFGDKNHHEFSLNISNMWFFGFIFFVCCIGYRYKELKNTISSGYQCIAKIFNKSNELNSFSDNQLKSSKKKIIAGMLLSVILFLVLFILLWNTYEIHHTYNTSRYLGFLRNKILAITTVPGIAKGLFGIVSLTGLYSFLAYPIIRKSSTADFVFKISSIVPIVFMPLVEQRYYIPILALFLLFTSVEYFKNYSVIQTKKLDKDIDYTEIYDSHFPAKIQTIFNLIVSIYLFISILTRSFFL